MPKIYLTIPVLVILLSVMAVLSPRLAWWLRDGWKFKNAEPSRLALISARISGLIGIVAGSAMFYVLYRQP